jgi:hypothetical protein
VPKATIVRKVHWLVPVDFHGRLQVCGLVHTKHWELLSGLQAQLADPEVHANVPLSQGIKHVAELVHSKHEPLAGLQRQFAVPAVHAVVLNTGLGTLNIPPLEYSKVFELALPAAAYPLTSGAVGSTFDVAFPLTGFKEKSYVVASYRQPSVVASGANERTFTRYSSSAIELKTTPSDEAGRFTYQPFLVG